MSSRNFGYSNLNKSNVDLYELENKNGLKVNILSLGAAIQSIILPWSSDDKPLNVVLGYDTVKDYDVNNMYFGVIVGRVAGRIKNGSFKVGDNEYKVTTNNCGNCLHGGKLGLSKKIWKLINLTSNSVELEVESCHNEDGFPGHLTVQIKYSLNDNNELCLSYSAKINDEGSCPINLTNHSYFNLSGAHNEERGIKDHIANIGASKTLELGNDLTPTGKILNLSDLGALDLSKNNEKLEGMLSKVGLNPKGYDHYYILDNPSLDTTSEPQAVVTDGKTKLSFYTDQPGVQFYTSNFFDTVKVAGDYCHQQYGALCLEAQNYPDAINHDNFPNCILDKDNQYTQTTIYRFSQV